MEGIVHIFLIHGFYQQSNRLNHHHGIAGLDGNDHIVEVFPSADTQKFHTTLHDSCRSVTITAHDTVAQRTVIHTDADGGMVLFADIQERNKLAFYLLQFGGIFLVGVFQMLEHTTRIHIIARIDAHLLTIKSGHIGRMGCEMHISHQWLWIAVGFQLGRDMLHILSFAGALGGKAHQFATGIDDAFGLCHRCLGVIGIGGSHRLYSYRIVAAYQQITHLRSCCLSSLHIIKVKNEE